MSAQDDEATDPYRAPRVASAPEAKRVRVVSMEPEHVAIVRDLRRSATTVALFSIVVGLAQCALGVSAVYVYATEIAVTWATFLPSGMAMIALYSLLTALFVLGGISTLLVPGSAGGNGSSLYRGGWRFTTAGMNTFGCAFLTIDWLIPILAARSHKPPAHATVTILLAAAVTAAFAAVVFFLLWLPARRLFRRLIAANLPLESMVDEEGRVVVRLSKANQSNQIAPD